jgi:tRNA pseudouridine38-40 synthase
VHALGQSACFRTAVLIPLERFGEALNGRLPADVRVRAVEEVTAEFHARFSARGKHYRYLLYRRPSSSPFLARYALWWAKPLALPLLRETAAGLVGRHDFASFRCEGGGDVSTTRTLHAIQFLECGPFVAFDFWGDGFLYKMVRTLSGTLLEVGRGRWTPADVIAALQARDRRRAGPTAAAHGLYLMEVFYDPEAYRRSQTEPPPISWFPAGGAAGAASVR